MKAYAYNLTDGDFSGWLDANPDCEKLLLQGKIIAKEHGKQILAIEEALYFQQLKAIDISNLDATEFEEWLEMNYDYDSWNERWGDDGGIPNIMVQIVRNIVYATDFVWYGDAILSSDYRTLVYYKPQCHIAIPETVEVIGNSVFEDNDTIDYIKLPPSIKVIGNYAFSGCFNLDIMLPDTLTHIGEGAFYDCDLQKIVIPNGIDTVSGRCFSRNVFAKITIPATVKKICECAFDHCSSEIWLPDGVETIEYGAFGEVEFIHISSSVAVIDKEFYLDEDGCGDIPYVDVASDNPYFYDNKGTLYKMGESTPYLGKEYIPKQEKSLLVPKTEFVYERELSLEELKERYYEVWPINSEGTMYCIWKGVNGYYNIVDRYGNEYFDKKQVDKIIFSFDHFIIVNGHAVYSIDMKELLLDSSLLEYDITGCDKEGRIYVMKGYAMDEYYAPLFPDHPLPECWCIDVNGNSLLKHRYNGLGHFADDGWAPACIGKLWGMIDINENVVIPYAYKDIHPFDSEGMALVEKGTKKGYINRKGELVIPFRYNFFYKKFDEEGCAFAEIYKGNDAGGYFVNRKGEVLGKFQPKDKHEGVWNPGFHLFLNDGRWGFCRQFANKFSGCIFHDIKRINDLCIEVSIDGNKYQNITY